MKREHLTPIAHQLLGTHSVRGVRTGDLANAMEIGQVLQLDDGDTLCAEGDPPDALFLLVEGRVVVSRRDAANRDRTLATLEAPAMFGHMGLVDGSARSASCLASGDTLVISLNLKDCRALMAKSNFEAAALRRLILASLAQQLTCTNEQIRKMIDAGNLPMGFDDPEGGLTPHSERELTLSDVANLAASLEGWRVQGGP